MKQIVEFSNDASQKLTIVNEDNSTFIFELQYSSLQQSWFYNLTYGTFSLNGKRLVSSPNILRQYQNIIPFGMAVYTNDGDDPFLINDLQSQRAIVYLLTAADVIQIESLFYSS